MKIASDKEKERNKMLQEKQKKDKTTDKEKKKTQKGERRRMQKRNNHPPIHTYFVLYISKFFISSNASCINMVLTIVVISFAT